MSNLTIQQYSNTTIKIMTKKFDIKRTMGNPSPPLSIEAVEEMTKLIHNKKEVETVAAPTIERFAPPIIIEKVESPAKTTISQPKKAAPATVKVEKKVEPIAAPEPEKGRRGRKPNPIVETERLLRVSVDLPESVFIQLKILVIQQKTDMKAYIRKLVEKELN
jgi:hypothetical protein